MEVHHAFHLLPNLQNREKKKQNIVYCEYKSIRKMIESNPRVHLSAEVEAGNVEYKIQLLDDVVTEDRIEHLATQMNWRLNEGHGTAFYELGVHDNGVNEGISIPDLNETLVILEKICQRIGAQCYLDHVSNGCDKSKSKYVVRMKVKRRTPREHSIQQHLRISVIGSGTSGKSTLVGILTHGILDNGEGLARMRVFRHVHEMRKGQTSSISHHALGISKDGNHSSSTFVKHRNMDDDIFRDSHKIITFCDLAGDERYLKTTASGLTGQFPDYALLVVDASSMVLQRMTKEHLQIAIALEIPFFIVLTKIDLASVDQITQCCHELAEFLRTKGCVRNLVHVEDIGGATSINITNDPGSVLPVFHISNVTGQGLRLLKHFFTGLAPYREDRQNNPERYFKSHITDRAVFYIDDSYEVQDVGRVVSGIAKSGILSLDSTLLLGPDACGHFQEVVIESMEVQHVAVHCMYAGQRGAVFFKPGAHEKEGLANIRKGMTLIHPESQPRATLRFDAEIQVVGMTLKKNYEAMIHVGTISQVAKIIDIQHGHQREEKSCENAKIRCRFEFLFAPEFVSPDLPLIFRERRTNAVGRVIKPVYDDMHCQL